MAMGSGCCKVGTAPDATEENMMGFGLPDCPVYCVNISALRHCEYLTWPG